MGEITSIGWTTHTFNCWIGCTEVSAGCDWCYARELAKRYGWAEWGKGMPRHVMSDSYWQAPLKWDRKAKEEGRKEFVFCASLADVMDDEAPAGQRERLWDLIDRTPSLIWQLLTKRPHRYERYLPVGGFKHRNVWLGTTAENQEFYDIRLPILRRVAYLSGLTCFVSYEPAIGPVSMLGHQWVPDWIIFGGESGNNRRECRQEWAESLREEIRANNL